MGTSSGRISQFPSQAVSDKEKASYDYGLEVANAIEQEWFYRVGNTGGSSGQTQGSRLSQNRIEYHKLRLYSRGEQSVRKYKDELGAFENDLSYLNLDWEPVPIIPKFVDIVVNGMQDRLFSIKAFAQDKIATEKRTKFVDNVIDDMEGKEFNDLVQNETGFDITNFGAANQKNLPDTTEELELYMQLEYKQGIEVAIEQAIENVLKKNKYRELKKLLDRDQVVLGISCVKHGFNNTNGITVEYVDPANLVFNYPEDHDFRDSYYYGEVHRIRLNEVAKRFPHFSVNQLEEIRKAGATSYYDSTVFDFEFEDAFDENSVAVVEFEYKTFEETVHKVKETTTGGLKALKKDNTFNPPKDDRSRYSKTLRRQEVIYRGFKIIGQDNGLLMWEKATNMVRPDGNPSIAQMSYIVKAPKLYNGKIESLTRRMIKYADLIQLTHLKLQQSIQRMVPSGVYIDADGLNEIDLGNGTKYNPQEALNMYFQTGSVVGRSMTVDGDPTGSKVPIQALPASGGEDAQAHILIYNHYLNMIRDVTGLNEARDGSDPDPYSLVGVQKLAAANSNTATRHILQAGVERMEDLADGIAVRIKDVLEFHPQKDQLVRAIGKFSVGSLKELDNLHHHSFGIFLELSPDEEQKQLLEANIQQALAKDQIWLEDAIDVREIQNLKLANQLLKYRRKKKQAMDQEIAERNTQNQSEANAMAAERAEMAKAKAEMMKADAKIKTQSAQNDLDLKKIEFETLAKEKLMDKEFELSKQLIQFQTENGVPATGQKPVVPGHKESNNDNKGGIGTQELGPK